MKNILFHESLCWEGIKSMMKMQIIFVAKEEQLSNFVVFHYGLTFEILEKVENIDDLASF